MEIEFEQTKEDFDRFVLFFSLTSATHRKRRRVLDIIAIVIIILCVMLAIVTPKAWLGNSLLIFSYICIVLYYRNPKRQISRNTSKLLSERNYSSLIGKRVMSLEPNSLTVITNDGEEKRNWKSVDRIEQDNDYIYLFTTNMGG